MMDTEFELIRKAGRIACEAKKKAREIVKPGQRLLDIAQFIEGFINSMGGQPAFPVNISINSEAAHYSPLADDEKIVPEASIVKIDLGVSVDGYLADTAITIDFSGEYEDLIKASEEALNKAIESVSPNIKTSLIGNIIEKTIKSYGYKPIRNLSGHSMSRYVLHSGISIPNMGGEILSPTLKPPILIAIEPFATNGLGLVLEGKDKTIYSLTRQIGKKEKKFGEQEIDFLVEIFNERKNLPFTERWYARKYSLDFVRQTFIKAEKQRVVTSYPVLIESANGAVSQAEDTVLILDNDIVITTREC